QGVVQIGDDASESLIQKRLQIDLIDRIDFHLRYEQIQQDYTTSTFSSSNYTITDHSRQKIKNAAKPCLTALSRRSLNLWTAPDRKPTGSLCTTHRFQIDDSSPENHP